MGDRFKLVVLNHILAGAFLSRRSMFLAFRLLIVRVPPHVSWMMLGEMPRRIGELRLTTRRRTCSTTRLICLAALGITPRGSRQR